MEIIDLEVKRQKCAGQSKQESRDLSAWDFDFEWEKVLSQFMLFNYNIFKDTQNSCV